MTILNRLVPSFVKPLSKSLYQAFTYSHLYKRKIAYRPKPRNVLHQYWREPWDGVNLPQEYLVEGKENSQLLVDIMKRYSTLEAKILEIGCNVGRNLNYLFIAGFKNLEGIEISEKAVQLLQESYPEMGRSTKIYIASVEDVIIQFRDFEFDIVFTMAVLEHIHKDSEWIFPEMVRVAGGFLITIEDEHGVHWRKFPRNYRNVFEPLGMEQLEGIDLGKIKELPSTMMTRIFKRKFS